MVERCHLDGKRCYTGRGTEDAHWRCGTSACGLGGPRLGPTFPGWVVRLVWAGLLVLCLAAYYLVFLVSTAWGRPSPDQVVSPPVKAWFEAQRNQAGGHCCELADGHVLTTEEWRTAERGVYEVLLFGQWREIKPWQLIKPSPLGANPTGGAIVWYIIFEGGLQVLCFTPGDLL